MKKKKIKVYFTMDEELYKDFEKHIEDNILDRSRLIERLIEEYLKRKQKL
jgi:metal-responsive CopG/Arc/MetJ family transcriptional regulator